MLILNESWVEPHRYGAWVTANRRDVTDREPTVVCDPQTKPGQKLGLRHLTRMVLCIENIDAQHRVGAAGGREREPREGEWGSISKRAALS